MSDIDSLNKEYPIGSILTLDSIADIPEYLQVFEWKFIRLVGKHKYYERVN